MNKHLLSLLNSKRSMKYEIFKLPAKRCEIVAFGLDECKIHVINMNVPIMLQYLNWRIKTLRPNLDVSFKSNK